MYPLFKEIPYCCPQEIVTRLPHEGIVYLDSAQNKTTQGRYSFIAFSPFKTLSSKNGVVTLNQESCQADPFTILRKELAQWALRNHPELPPFQGGVAGMFGYELGRYLEKLPSRALDDQPFPEIQLGFYDLVIAWDHHKKGAWIFSSGEHAQKRLEWTLTLIKTADPKRSPSQAILCDDQIVSNFTRQQYIEAVQKVVEYIRQGDIFQANISQRFSAKLPSTLTPFELYQRLRANNPSPFGAYLQFGIYAIASQSPERFLQLIQQKVEARPIKGTRPRHVNQEEDAILAQGLLQSEKDRAENIMIVDLMRNDLSRVCLPHSVLVPSLCHLESFATVHHLVSVIQGQLMPNKTAMDLLEATFPGGSITGAPKIRAMEIIDEIEPNLRGPYCGSIGYIGFNGDMDLSITIRTFTIKENVVTFQVGGAVTIDSQPEEEYQETLVKARALHRTLTQADGL